MSDLISRWLGRPLHLVFGAAILVSTAGAPVRAAPMASALELAKAERIGQMPDEAPSHRINQILAAKDFNEAELFALAGTHPVLVQHFTDGELKLATDYLLSLDGAELHKMRIGGTLIRMTKSLSAKEKKTLEVLSDYLEEDHGKLRGVKIGPQDGRAYVLQLTYQIKKKKQRTYEFELVPPATPQREEEARVALTKYFRARPSRVGQGVGSSLKLKDGSFENPYALADTWRLMQGTMLGAPSLSKRSCWTSVRQLMVHAACGSTEQSGHASSKMSCRKCRSRPGQRRVYAFSTKQSTSAWSSSSGAPTSRSR